MIWFLVYGPGVPNLDANTLLDPAKNVVGAIKRGDASSKGMTAISSQHFCLLIILFYSLVYGPEIDADSTYRVYGPKKVHDITPSVDKNSKRDDAATKGSTPTFFNDYSLC